MTSEQIGNALAPVNALLNTTSTALLIAGYVAIRRKKVPVHRACMIGAFVASCVFLAGYLTRFALTGSHSFPQLGWVRSVYLAILFSHMVLAAVTVPLVLRTLFLAYKKRFDAHRKIAKITYPIWLYVSFTGVVVYLMLYHLAPALAPRL
jgi:putative membrane protein